MILQRRFERTICTRLRDDADCTNSTPRGRPFRLRLRRPVLTALPSHSYYYLLLSPIPQMCLLLSSLLACYTSLSAEWTACSRGCQTVSCRGNSLGPKSPRCLEMSDTQRSTYFPKLHVYRWCGLWHHSKTIPWFARKTSPSPDLQQNVAMLDTILQVTLDTTSMFVL